METEVGLSKPWKQQGAGGERLPLATTAASGMVGAVLVSGQPKEMLPRSCMDTEVALGTTLGTALGKATATTAAPRSALLSALPLSALRSMHEEGSMGMDSGQASGESSILGTAGLRARSGVSSCLVATLLPLEPARPRDVSVVPRLRAVSALALRASAATFSAGTLAALLTGCHLPLWTCGLAWLLMSPVLAHRLG